MSRSDGSTASYYELPNGCSELQDLISHRDMNAQIGEIFRACYRYGIADHSDRLRDAKKMRFYAEAEIKRLEKMLETAKRELCVEPASAIDDDSPRAQAIGQNGNTGEHYGENKPDWSIAPEWAEFLAQDDNGRWYWYEHEPECDDAGWYEECGQYKYEQTGTVFSSFEVTLEPRPCQ